MVANPYLAFLPPARQVTASTVEADSSWWSWRGHHVHLIRARRPSARARFLVVHGAGAHGGALWPLASLLAAEGLDATAVDLPLYGRTITPDPRAVRYGDWIDLLVDLIDAEHDDRPLVLLGASMGGMLAYEVAARSPKVAAVAATCLLDPRDSRARFRMTRYGPLGVLSALASRLVRGRSARVMVPMNVVANLSKMSRDPALSRLCSTDALGGAAKVPLGFLASYVQYRHTPPEAMSTPVMLVHPTHDAWTPPELSVRVLQRVAAPTTAVMLRECGHFPSEEPGIGDLIAALRELADEVSARHPNATGEPARD